MAAFFEKNESFIECKEIVDEDFKLWILEKRLNGGALSCYIKWLNDCHASGKPATLASAYLRLQEKCYQFESCEAQNVGKSLDLVNKIKINCWSKEELQRCPYIGRNRVGDIIKLRDQVYFDKKLWRFCALSMYLSRKEMEDLGSRLDFRLPEASVSLTHDLIPD